MGAFKKAVFAIGVVGGFVAGYQYATGPDTVSSQTLENSVAGCTYLPGSAEETTQYKVDLPQSASFMEWREGERPSFHVQLTPDTSAAVCIEHMSPYDTSQSMFGEARVQLIGWDTDGRDFEQAIRADLHLNAGENPEAPLIVDTGDPGLLEDHGTVEGDASVAGIDQKTRWQNAADWVTPWGVGPQYNAWERSLGDLGASPDPDQGAQAGEQLRSPDEKVGNTGTAWDTQGQTQVTQVTPRVRK